MRFFLKFSLILSIILIITSSVFPVTYEMTFPREPGPTLNRQLRTNHKEYIEENQPDIVLLGDSTLVVGIESNELAKQINQTVYSIGLPGSASAIWYLLLKNNIAEATYKPKYLLIVFRDSILTAPGYRVHGSYFDLLDEYATQNEPVLIEKSFINLMNPFEITAEKYLPLYALRSKIRQKIDSNIRYITPSLLNCDNSCTDSAFSELFEAADMEPGALTNAISAAESLLYTPEYLNFKLQVDKSFLPDIIEIATAKDIKLVFVRIKVLTTPQNSAVFGNYLLDLENYFNEQGVYYLDFGADPRITLKHFQDTAHLTEQGKELFTQLVAEEMNKIFLEK